MSEPRWLTIKGYGFRAAWSLATAMVALSLLATMASAQFTSVKDDSLDEGWLIGHLGWTDGKGSIHWDESAPSEDDAASAPSPPPVIVFASDPLESALYVNVSRNLQFDLVIKEGSGTGTADCQPGKAVVVGLEVQLWVEGRLLAGAVDGQGIRHRDLHYEAPSGYVVCRYRMPAEVAFVPKGSVLELRLLNVNPAVGGFAFGFQGDHRSTLRIPQYSPTEAFYRHSRADRAAAATEGVSASDLLGTVRDLLPSLAPVALVAAAGRGRGGQRRSVLVLLLVAASTISLAGCAAPEGTRGGSIADPAENPTASVTFEDPLDTGLADESEGGILGVVYDEEGIPVANAFVAILGAPYSTRVGAFGEFGFAGLRPDLYRLRVDAETFVSVEAEVQVRANKVSRIELVLHSVGDLDPMTRPHRHDYWRGEERMTLFQGEQAYACYTGPTGLTQNCPTAWTIPIDPKPPGVLDLVVPGTATVEVNVTFDPDLIKADRLGLWVQANNDPEAGSTNWSTFLPRASGVPFVVQTNWEMADVGHQLFTTWRLRLNTHDRDPPGPTDTVNTPDPTGLAWRATITIRRGVLPLEPPHVDRWKGAESMPVDSDKTWTSGFNSLGGSVGYTVVNCGVGLAGGVAPYMSNLSPFFGSPEKVVPQGTTWVEVRTTQNRPTGLAGLARYDWLLVYNTGADPATDDGSSTWYGTTNRVRGALSSDGLVTTWRLPVAPNDADGEYNRRSAWTFSLAPDDFYVACAEADLYASHNPLRITEWSVVAHRTPMPT